jgi:hypothetical protein
VRELICWLGAVSIPIGALALFMIIVGIKTSSIPMESSISCLLTLHGIGLCLGVCALEKTGVLSIIPSFVTSLATVAENSFAAKKDRVTSL